MLSSFKKMRGDKKGWYKVSDLRPGIEIAVPSLRTPNSELRTLEWDEIVSITPVGREHVYDIEVEGTRNFVGNGIFAHNTYVLRANTMLAVEGSVNAESFIVPIGSQTSNASSGSLTSEIPPEVLTADGKGVDLYKLSTYNLATTTALAARVAAEEVKLTSLENRVTTLESGAVSSGSNIGIGTSSLASALSDLGVLIQRGIAQFNTLVFRQLVASKDADGTSSAGSVSILTGNTVAQVNNSLVLSSTKVFITFNSQITGSWWVSDKAAGSFRVVLSAPQAADVSFDYFLVQTEGQLQTTDSGTSEIGSSTPSSGTPVSGLQGDTTAPVITVLGDNPLHVSVGGVYVDPGVTAVDAVDGAVPITTFVDGIQSGVDAIDTSSQTTHIITYSATDQRGNLATATRAVIVGSDTASSATTTTTITTPTDTTPPVVTLIGDAAMEVTVGGVFTDPGATAADNVDGDLTANIVVTGSVDTATAGLYTLTYTATDAAGNIGSVSRVVTVIAAP